MGKSKLRGKDLAKLGYPKDGNTISLAINIARAHYKYKSKAYTLDLFSKVLATPKAYRTHEFLNVIAEQFLKPEVVKRKALELVKEEDARSYKVYGSKHINTNAKEQMNIAMRLPITTEGALMADAHAGYGLPIGGVIATENAVIPYGVGMDIGCRMCLSIYDIPTSYISQKRPELKSFLVENSRFGKTVFDKTNDSEVLDRSVFSEIPILRKLKDKAFRQLGSSGSGNHFVEFGIVDIREETNEMGLPAKKYFGLLTHSGSRGLGANIAQYYTKIAKEKCLLPREAQQLAWLNLDTQEGMEYWLAMNLAGDYASACHHDIHHRMSLSLGEKPLAVVENHHNFAWKETLSDGREVIVHRKGATPAGKGVLGIIPGSMTAPGYIVRGKGSALSINSASHGAGRLMSRTKARNSTTKREMRQYLAQKEVHLIGGDLDESPMAYKDIEKVMRAQTDLVDVLGTFLPKIVRMAKANE